MNLEDFIAKHIETIEPIETASHLAWWNLATTGDSFYAQQIQETTIALRKIYSEKKDYQFLLSHQSDSDPLRNRQAKLLLHQFTENQISPDLIEKIVKLETEIESIYTNFRAVIGEESVSNNDLKDILIHNNDSQKRQQAWEASKLIGEQVEEKVLQLVNLRNESAKQAGFDNYYTMRLELQELDEKALFKLLDDLDAHTTSQWQFYKARLDAMLAKRYQVIPTSILPWHYHDPFFQEAPKQDLDFDLFYKDKDIVEISRRFCRTVDLPADDIIDRSDLFERERKNQHAFCSCIDRKQDIRILANIRDNEYWMGTQLHELGHGVYDKFIDQSLPYLLRAPAHTSTTEAVAMMFGRLSTKEEFLHHYCSVNPKKAQEISSKSKQQMAAQLLVFARWALVMIHFERDLYQKPGADLNQLWWDYVEKFQWVRRVPARNKPDWASKLHLACSPVYYQNYILGELTASQLTYSINQTIGTNFCSSPKTGSWLKTKLFSFGARFSWDQTIQKATGEPLNPRFFADDVQSS